MPKTSDILAVILGGGQGKRLYPLTVERSKPAVPIAGKYRLIDITISNCINSNIPRIAVLTQFNSVSLHRHISQTYVFDSFHSGWVQIWAAEQTMEHTDWYQGTADAVRAEFHWANNADVTVAVQPVPKDEAPRFGLLKRDENGRIIDFAEKPKDPVRLASMVSRDDPEKPYLGSMGIYLFNTNVLMDVLRPDRTTEQLDDFGGDIIPYLIQNGTGVYGYNFDGYWRDIGTIRSFYETNLALTEENPGFNFYDPDKPIFTHPRFLPCSQVIGCTLKNTLIAEGCLVSDATIEHSIIGLRSQIGEGSVIKDSIVMGADYYGTLRNGAPIGIGKNCQICCAIIDKNASIGDNVVIKPFPVDRDIDHSLYAVRDGIVVIPKHTTIPAGTVIAP